MMAFQSHRTNFKGDLAGVEQNSIIQLDYTLESLEKRINYIKTKYKEISEYHEEYTSDYYKVEVNSNDNLSADINIFKAIERDASYLLNSLDVPKEREYRYNLLTQEEFDKLLRGENKADLYSDSFLNILKPDFTNDYINLSLVVSKRDILEDSEMGEILRQYNDIRECLKDEMRKIKMGEESHLKLYQIKSLLSGLIGDMLDTKRIYKGIRRPSTKLGDIGSCPDYDKIDYSNKDHVKAIISNVKFGEIQPDSELSHIAYDIEVAINGLHQQGMLDELDLEIVNCINSGMSNVSTAKEVGRDESTIRSRVNKICRRISMYYES